MGSSGGGDSASESYGSGFNTSGSTSGGIDLGQGVNSSLSQSTGRDYSDQSSQSSSQDSIYGAQEPYLADKWQGAQDMYNAQQPALANEAQFAGDMTRNVQNDAMNQWQNTLSDGNVNSYTNQMKQSVAGDAGRAQEQMLGQMDARAAASGMSGGARHGQAIGQGMTGINDAMQREQANIGFQAEEAARNRQQQALGMSNDMSNLSMGGFNPLNAQWSGLNNYSNIVGDPTKLGSTDQSSQSSSYGTQDSTNASLGQSQNLGFNFGLGQNYGENATGSEADNNSWNAGWTGM